MTCEFWGRGWRRVRAEPVEVKAADRARSARSRAGAHSILPSEGEMIVGAGPVSWLSHRRRCRLQRAFPEQVPVACAPERGVVTVAGAAPASGAAGASILFRSSRFTPAAVEDAAGDTAAIGYLKESCPHGSIEHLIRCPQQGLLRPIDGWPFLQEHPFRIR